MTSFIFLSFARAPNLLLIDLVSLIARAAQVHLLDALHKHCLRSKGLRPRDPRVFQSKLGETTPVHRIFGGHLRSQLKCPKCGHCSNRFKAVWLKP